MCIRCALPYHSQFVTSNAYVQYVSTQILPNLEKVTEAMASHDAPGTDLEVLQLLAELTPSVHPSNPNQPIDVAACETAILNQLTQFIPLPPLEIAGDEIVVEPSLQFTHVESLLFSFHQLGKHNADVLSEEAKLKDLKTRLTYLARGVQNYIKKLKDSLGAAKKGQLQSEEDKMKEMALKTTTNIQTMIRDLFHIPPSFKSVVALSWKPVVKASPGKPAPAAARPIKAVAPKAVTVVVPKAAQNVENTNTENGNATNKRKAIEAPESDPKPIKKTSPQKTEQKVYEPPSGKFSTNNRGGFNAAVRGRGGWTRGRGGGRYSKRFNKD